MAVLATLPWEKLREIILGNRTQHADGVRQQIASLTARGYTLLGTNVYATVAGVPFTRYYDFVVMKDGNVYGVEIKTTRTGNLLLDEQQVKFDVATISAGNAGSGAVSPTLPGVFITGVIYQGVNFGTRMDATWKQARLLRDLSRAGVPHDVYDGLPGGR